MTSTPVRPLRQRTIGILGGMSNQATGEYYRLLNESLNARLGGWDNGEIVVALVDGSEATLKRYYREGDGRVRLQPANAAMQPIYVPAESLEIQGRVLAIMRKY